MVDLTLDTRPDPLAAASTTLEAEVVAVAAAAIFKAEAAATVPDVASDGATPATQPSIDRDHILSVVKISPADPPVEIGSRDLPLERDF